MLLALAPVMAACSSSSDIFTRDADWFQRAGRLSISNVSISAPPLSPTSPVGAQDLVSAEGYCAGMPQPGGPDGAQALADGPAGAPAAGGTVALGHTECDVVRGIGAPENVNLSSNPRGERQAVITWLHGSRAGIYTFTAGRLSSIDAAPQQEAPVRPVKPKKKASKAAT
jgi:hypothetical protein